MHEYSITCSIIEILDGIAKEKQLKKVEQVDFEINDFACIEPESIRFYYEFLTKDNPTLGNAKLNFKKISPEMSCNNCKHVFRSNSFETRCPECDSPDIRFKVVEDIKIIAVHAENP